MSSAKFNNSKVRENSVRNVDDSNSSSSDAMLEEASKCVAGKRDKDGVCQEQLRNGYIRNKTNASSEGNFASETGSSSNDEAANRRTLKVTLDQRVSKEATRTASRTAPSHSATSTLQNLLPRRGVASSEVRFHCNYVICFADHLF